MTSSPPNLKTPAESTPAEVTPAAPSEETSGTRRKKPALSRGTLVDRYTILEPLGSGGFATVYSAYDSQLERVVALKLLQPDVNQPNVRRRMFGEAQAMARLKHPNVVTVYDVGKFRRQIYIAMECVEGSTFAVWVKTPRQWREILNILKSAARGLAAAHEAGLVHRDFKPDNVLVGNDGRVMVSDFGVARPAVATDGAVPSAVRRTTMSPVQSSRPDSSSHLPTRGEEPLTEPGRVMGTHGYLAPERFTSDLDDVRSDQFSFCVATYVALYGRHPFAFTDVESYCHAVLKPPRTPPSSTKVPRWVHAVIERGLKPDPEQRFASMKELLEALERDPSRRRRFWALGAFVAAACAVAATAYGRHRVDLRTRASEGVTLMAATWNPTMGNAIRASLAEADPKYGSEIAAQVVQKIDEYAATWIDTHRRICEATLLHGEQDAVTMARRLRCLERGREQLGALGEILSHADAAVAQRAPDATFALPAPTNCAKSDVTNIPPLPAASDVRARVLSAEHAVAQAQAYGKVGHDQRAKEIVERALPEVRAIPYPRTEAELLLLDSESKLQLSDKSGALEAAHAAYRAAVRAGDDALAVRAATSIVYVQAVWFHNVQEAEQWVELAAATADRAGHSDVIDAELLLARASINANNGHPEGNVEILEKQIAISKRLYGNRDPRVAKPIMDYGISLALLGQYEPAVKNIQEGLELMAATGGSHNPRLALYYLNLAGALDPLSRFEEAKRAHEHGLELLADRPPGPLNVVFLGQLAMVEKELGNIDSSFAYAERALEVARAIGERGKFEWHARYAHAQARGKKGDWAGQAAECAEIFTLQRAAGQAATTVLFWPDSLVCVAEAELAMGKVDAAIAHLEDTVKLESRGEVEALPRAKFELAKTLRVANRDANRARQLAESARNDLSKVVGREREVAKIDQWLGETQPVGSTP